MTVQHRLNVVLRTFYSKVKLKTFIDNFSLCFCRAEGESEDFEEEEEEDEEDVVAEDDDDDDDSGDDEVSFGFQSPEQMFEEVNQLV